MTKAEFLRHLREQTFRAYERKAFDKGYLCEIIPDSKVAALSTEELSVVSDTLRDLLRTQ